MAAKKKGFVLYFDSYDALEAMDAAQRGELLLALYRYAGSVAERDVSPWEFLRSCDALNEKTGMAFCFMAGNIRRDTMKWQERREHCSIAQRRYAAETAQKESSNDRRTASMAKYINQ